MKNKRIFSIMIVVLLTMSFWATAQDESPYDTVIPPSCINGTFVIPDFPDQTIYDMGLRNGVGKDDIWLKPIDYQSNQTQWSTPCESPTADSVKSCGAGGYGVQYIKMDGAYRYLDMSIKLFVDIDEPGVLSSSVGSVSNDTVYLPNGTSSTILSVSTAVFNNFNAVYWYYLKNDLSLQLVGFNTSNCDINIDDMETDKVVVKGLDNSSYTSYDTIVVIEPPVWTWQGSSNDWSATSNWSEGTVPTASDEVTIPVTANTPLVSDPTAVCSTLTIESGATLTISPAGGLEVKDQLTNNGSLTIQSNDQGTGSLITRGSVSGNYTVEQYLTAQRWWYMSSPVVDATSDVFSPDANALYWWNETNTGTHGWNEITSTTPLEEMRGYAYQKTSEGDTTLSFQGTVNAGECSSNLTVEGATFTGYNLVGNPYPSAIELGLFESLQGIEAINMIPSIWFRGDNFFAAYNWMSGVSQNGAKSVVSPMQGFWVKVDDNYTSGSLIFNDSCRVHPDTSLFKQEAEQEVLRLELLQVSSQIADELVIGFWPQAQQGRDAYDSPKYYANRYAEISALVDDESMAIAGFNDPVPVNLEIKATMGDECKVAIKKYSLPYHIFLEDRANGEWIDLKKQSYSFVYQALNDRFVLHFQDATGVETLQNDQINMYPNPATDYIQIKSQQEVQSVKILTLAGSTVKQLSCPPGNRISIQDIAPGMYIIQATTVDKKILVSKLFAR